MLDAFNGKSKSREIESCVIENEAIEAHNRSLWVYDYIELIPKSPFEMDCLGKYIDESGYLVKPSEDPENNFVILGVSNRIGVFENETFPGAEIRQKYKRVKTGDLVYNPHRVNVGSLGLVGNENDGGHVSGIYVVFKSKDAEEMPPAYLLWLLKSPPYKRIIEAYDTKFGAVRANLTYAQLCRIKIPLLKGDAMKKFIKKQQKVEANKQSLRKAETAIADYLKTVAHSDVNIQHLEDFNTILSCSISPPTKLHQT
jgi:type I restriction enzyme S subunit